MRRTSRSLGGRIALSTLTFSLRTSSALKSIAEVVIDPEDLRLAEDLEHPAIELRARSGRPPAASRGRP
jgi:hypothetical protein